MSRASQRFLTVCVAALACWAPWPATAAQAAPKPLIDINSASRAELKTLPGIGDAQAERIVKGRPYLSKTDLVAAKAIPAGTYLQIKRSIIAKPPSNAKRP